MECLGPGPCLMIAYPDVDVEPGTLDQKTILYLIFNFVLYFNLDFFSFVLV